MESLLTNLVYAPTPRRGPVMVYSACCRHAQAAVRLRGYGHGI